MASNSTRSNRLTRFVDDPYLILIKIFGLLGGIRAVNIAAIKTNTPVYNICIGIVIELDH